MSSYDKEYVDRLLAEFGADLAFAAARQRLLFALKWRAHPVRSPGWPLVRAVDGKFLHHAPRAGKRFAWWSESAGAVTPIGWRWEFLCDRDAVLIMPAWVYYPRRWWRMLRWRYFLLRHRDPTVGGKR